MNYQEVRYDVADRICTITLHRPDARNGYTLRMSDELADAFAQAEADQDVRVIVLTGSGDDFCVGADLSGGSLNASEDDAGQGWQEPAGRCSRAIFESSKPVIAAIRGAAVGAGSTIILPADYRIAATDSRFGFVFSRRGIYPEGASVWFLPRLVGMGAALDWMISGRVFGADEALTAGMLHQVHESDEVLDKAYELAHDLVTNTAPVSVAVIRQMLYRLSPLDSPSPAHRVDSRLIAGCADDPDAIEGVMSFLQRRPPEFTGKVPTDIPDWLPWRDDSPPGS
ncbi:enoyl-CoA hydratase-related protein [Haloechinothrix halophila]|uniref:enoyl-CoA hydratase-related protein n=1 Tax=Haloechinothrix halophila TaxID=1069073 RepID=UPI0004185104|nr:enoyl-CoA hydratase-related protein [Haloechinothrix halophila]